MVDITTPPDPSQNASLRDLLSELMKDHLARKLDGYELYLYGIVLKRLELFKEAVDVLVEATHKEPLHWGSWLELETLITDRTKLNSLILPDHWMKQFFLGHTYLEQQLNEDALEIYCALQQHGFSRSTYLIAQAAIAFHNRRDVDAAIATFRRLQKFDPYRLDNLDTYSNLLYVKELRVELAHLAHQACEIDKYRVETCCVVGNYYSLRSEHQKAVLYFQRALKLNPQYLSAWTLMGHEFMEMKNTNAAIQSYRQAIEVNRRDYRAWLYDKLQEQDHAAAAYTEYVTENESRADKSEMSQAFRYLANYYVKRNRVDDAYKYAQKCLEFEETKEEGKALLRTIAQKRSQQEEGEMQVEEDSASVIRVRPRLTEGTPANHSPLSPMNLSFTI
ncbi:Cell division cycle protein 23 [Blattella germanica]|nr:Cell division cycle protein 23 [Blattella germanica]